MSDALARGVAERGAQGVVAQQIFDGPGQRGGVAAGHEQARAAPQQFGHAAHGGGDHRHAGGHGFHQRHGNALVRARQDHGVDYAALIKLEDALVLQLAEQLDVVHASGVDLSLDGRARGPFAREPQFGGRGDGGKGLQQLRVVLLGSEPGRAQKVAWARTC